MREFSLTGFAAFLTGVAIAAEHGNPKGLEKGSKILLKEVQSEHGTYQGAASPFAAWRPLAEATKADRSKKGFPADEPLLRTGQIRDSYAYKSGNKEAEVGSNDMIAVYQELGTSKMPPRSTLGHSAVVKEKEIVEAIGHGAVIKLFPEAG